jgi:hypothetical protein
MLDNDIRQLIFDNDIRLLIFDKKSIRLLDSMKKDFGLQHSSDILVYIFLFFNIF